MNATPFLSPLPSQAAHFFRPLLPARATASNQRTAARALAFERLSVPNVIWSRPPPRRHKWVRGRSRGGGESRASTLTNSVSEGASVNLNPLLAVREWQPKVWSGVGKPREECFGIIGRRRLEEAGRSVPTFQPLLTPMGLWQ